MLAGHICQPEHDIIPQKSCKLFVCLNLLNLVNTLTVSAQNVSNVAVSHRSKLLHPRQLRLDINTNPKLRKRTICHSIRIDQLRIKQLAVLPKYFIGNQKIEVDLRLFELTFRTYYMIASQTLVVADDIVVVVVGHLAGVTDKRSVVGRPFAGRLAFMRTEFDLLFSLFVHLLSKDVGSRLEVDPNVTQLGNEPEMGAFQLVKIVTKLVRTQYEIRTGSLDSQLYLRNDKAVKFNVDKDIVGALLQPVLHPNYLHLLRKRIRNLSDLLVDTHYLTLLRRDLATHQVPHAERQQVRRRRPTKRVLQFAVVLILEKFLSHDVQPVDESIEIGNQVTVQIIDDLNRISAANLLQVVLVEGRSLLPSTPLNLLPEQLQLHRIVVGRNLLQKQLDLYLLLPEQTVKVSAHGEEQTVDGRASLHLDMIGVVRVVVWSGELLPQLLAPLRQYPQNGGTLYLHVHTLDLLLAEQLDTLGDLPADGVMGVFPYFVLVILLLYLPRFRLFGLLIAVVDLVHPQLLKPVTLANLSNRIEYVGSLPLLHRLAIVLLLLFHMAKNSRHIILKILIVCHPLGLMRLRLHIDPRHHIVHHAHNEIVVVAPLPVLEHHLTKRKIVVVQRPHVVDLLHYPLQLPVRLLRIRQRVLLLQQNQKVALKEIIDVDQIGNAKRDLLVLPSHILQNVHRTESLRLLEIHLLPGKSVEGYRKSLSKYFFDPSLQLFLLRLYLLLAG